MRRAICLDCSSYPDLFMNSQSMCTKTLTASFFTSPSRPATNWSTRCHFGSKAFVLTKLVSSSGFILAISHAARNSWNIKWRKQYCDSNLELETFLFGMRLNKPQFSIPCTSCESNTSCPSSIPFFANAPALFTVSGKSSFPTRKSCVNVLPWNSGWCLKINNLTASLYTSVEVDGKGLGIGSSSWSLRRVSNREQMMRAFTGM